MKTQVNVLRIVVSGVLLAGLAYSILGLAPATKIAYASSCDCTESYGDAGEYCSELGIGQLTSFTCPSGPQSDTYTFTCSGYSGPLHGPCNDAF